MALNSYYRRATSDLIQLVHDGENHLPLSPEGDERLKFLLNELRPIVDRLIALKWLVDDVDEMMTGLEEA